MVRIRVRNKTMHPFPSTLSDFVLGLISCFVHLFVKCTFASNFVKDVSRKLFCIALLSHSIIEPWRKRRRWSGRCHHTKAVTFHFRSWPVYWHHCFKEPENSRGTFNEKAHQHSWASYMFHIIFVYLQQHRQKAAFLYKEWFDFYS